MYSLTGIDSGKKIAYIGLGLTHFVYSINQSLFIAGTRPIVKHEQ